MVNSQGSESELPGGCAGMCLENGDLPTAARNARVSVGARSTDGATTVADVVKGRICCGCGACVAACPAGCIAMRYGRRYNWPEVDAERCTGCGRCVQVCPSAFLLNGTRPDFEDDLQEASYPCYLIHCPDDAVRVDAASGGGITGLILHMLETGQADGAVVARCVGADPLVAESFVARSREEVLDAQGSKYTPVSNCAALRGVLDRPGRYVFVGTPCMVEGLTRLQGVSSVLAERVVLKIAMVCSGMPSRLSTRRYLERAGVDADAVGGIRYRGGGWPGRFQAFDAASRVLVDRPYLGDAVNHVVGQDRYLRCWNCVDHWGYFADVVVSDPWTEAMVEHERKGWSAFMLRTDRGRQVVEQAVAAGALAAQPITMEDMLGYNRHLLLGPEHSRWGWMAAYQLVFRRRFRYMWPILKNLVRRRQAGLLTTLKARLQRRYYY